MPGDEKIFVANEIKTKQQNEYEMCDCNILYAKAQFFSHFFFGVFNSLFFRL